MAVFTEPTKWGTPLVVTGDTNVIPQSTPSGTGAFSFDDGFPQITQIPLSAGGVAPDRKDFNAVIKLLGDYIFYMMNGGVASYTATYDYPIGALIKHDNLYFKSISPNGPSSTVADPYNQTYWVKIPTYNDIYNFVPTGIILPYAGQISSIPSSYLACNGANISRTTFSNLFDVIGTIYGVGDGSTTFGIPDLRDRYIIGANTNALGTYVTEQLPNVKGAMEHGSGEKLVTLGSGDGISGAFSAQFKTMQYSASTNTGNYAYRLEFNAHNSNNIYTDSGKVYPASVSLNFIIRY